MKKKETKEGNIHVLLLWGMQVSPALRVFCSSKRHGFHLGGMGTQGCVSGFPQVRARGTGSWERKTEKPGEGLGLGLGPWQTPVLLEAEQGPNSMIQSSLGVAEETQVLAAAHIYSPTGTFWQVASTP